MRPYELHPSNELFNDTTDWIQSKKDGKDKCKYEHRKKKGCSDAKNKLVQKRK